MFSMLFIAAVVLVAPVLGFDSRLLDRDFAKDRPRMDRIVGGVESTIDRHPHVVALLIQRNGQLSLRCGGSILTPNWVITAGHCQPSDDEADQLWIRAGSSSHSSGGQLVKVAEFIQHEEYLEWFLWNDIAMMRLDTSLELDKNVNPLAVAKQLPMHGQRLNVAGWGRNNEQDATSLPNILHEVDLPLWDDQLCQEQYWLVWPTVQFCAGGTYEGNVGVCFGDSGSPITYQGEVVGLTSGGEACAGSLQPSIFTRMPHYIKWLDSVMHRNTNKDIEKL